MNAPMNPTSLHAPLGMYSHCMRVPANAEWLVISGQVGVDAKGRVAEGIRKQAEQAYRNVLACLRANTCDAEAKGQERKRAKRRRRQRAPRCRDRFAKACVEPRIGRVGDT